MAYRNGTRHSPTTILADFNEPFSSIESVDDLGKDRLKPGYQLRVVGVADPQPHYLNLRWCDRHQQREILILADDHTARIGCNTKDLAIGCVEQ